MRRWRRSLLVAALFATLAPLALAAPASGAPPEGEGPCRRWTPPCAVEQVVYRFFGEDDGRMVTASLLRWLIRMPNFAGSNSAVADAAQVTRAAGWALLLGLVTFAVFHYYALGLTSQGGTTALFDAVSRCVGAALLILAWPWLFENGVALTGTLSHAFLPGAELEAFLREMAAGGIAGAVFGGPILIVGIIIGLAFVLLGLALYLTKLGLTVGLLIAYVAMPLAAALWAVPSTAQPASYAARFCAAAATTQVTWAICLKVVAALHYDAWLGDGAGPWTENITRALVVVAGLGAMLSMPRHTFQAWGLGLGGSSGVLGQAASWMTSQAAVNTASRIFSRSTLERVGGAGLVPRWRSARRASAEHGKTQSAQQPSERAQQARERTQRPHEPTQPADRSRPGAAGQDRSRPAPSGNGRAPSRAGELPTGATSEQQDLAYARSTEDRRNDAAAVQTALEHLTDAGYGGPLRQLFDRADYGGGTKVDAAITERLAASSVAQGIDASVSRDFAVLAASTPAARAEGWRAWTSQTASDPQPQPQGPPDPQPQPPPARPPDPAKP